MKRTRSRGSGTTYNQQSKPWCRYSSPSYRAYEGIHLGVRSDTMTTDPGQPSRNQQFSAEARAKALSQPDRTRGFLVQLDSVFHTRVNILLVAESLFLAALSQIWASRELAIILLVCAIAILTTKLLWDPLRVL